MNGQRSPGSEQTKSPTLQAVVIPPPKKLPMLTQTPKTTYLSDYTPPAYRISTIDLRFELGEDSTTVHSRLRIFRAEATPAGTPLALDGQHLELLGLELDGIAARRRPLSSGCQPIDPARSSSRV